MTVAFDARAPSAPTLIDGKYQLEKEIGHGGQAQVWRAAELLDGTSWRTLALKLLEPVDVSTGDGTAVTAWRREVEAVRGIVCDALPVIYGIGIHDTQPYIAMELLEGESLEGRLKEAPVYWREALAIVKAVATALDACHAKGVVHCDLKPSNVFLEHAGKRRVLVLDFGAATLSGEAQVARRTTNAGDADPTADDLATRTVTVDVPPPRRADQAEAAPEPPRAPAIGTIGYISPERLRQRPPDTVSDVFSLGVMLYRMLTGRLPQDADPNNKAALIDATLNREFVPMEQVVSDLPPGVVHLVAALMGPEEGRPKAGSLAATIEKVWQRPYGIPSHPFAGLAALDIERAAYLAGRQGAVNAIVERLRSERGIVLMGPSGMGKSSLAASGVARRVDEAMLDDTEGWECHVVRPSARTEGLRNAESDDASEAAPPGVGTLVVVDQLEEVLALSAAERRAFAKAFHALVQRRAAVMAGRRRIDPERPSRVVVTVRGDLFDAVARLPEWTDSDFLTKHIFLVRDVDPNDLERIVLAPLEDAGYALEKAEGVDVVGDVVREVRADGAVLPLVQFALSRLWQGRDETRKMLPVAAWRSMGGIQGALANAAEAVFTSLGEKAHDAMKAACLALFNETGTRAVVVEDDVEPAVRKVLVRLQDEGIVRRGVDAQGQAVFDVVHEALGRNWGRLQQWMAEREAKHALQRAAADAARQWDMHGRPVDLVWRGALLEDNLAALQALDGEPTKAFVAASRAELERVREEAERARRRKFWLERVLPASFLITVAVVASVGWIKTTLANEKAENARMVLDRANRALATTNRDLETSNRVVDAKNEALRKANEELRREKDAAEKAKKDAKEKEAEAVAAKEKLEDEVNKHGQCRAVLQKTVSGIFTGPP